MVPRSTNTASKQTIKPFNEGYQAFLDGNLGNPYQANTKDNRDWEMGFNKAYFKNKELVIERELRERGKKVHSAKT
jgi:hypothetical protein